MQIMAAKVVGSREPNEKNERIGRIPTSQQQIQGAKPLGVRKQRPIFGILGKPLGS
jgi:hypothetical protein